MSLALRDELVSMVSHWAGRSGLAVGQLLSWLGLPPSKYHAWQARRGLPNRHNAPVPKAQWLVALGTGGDRGFCPAASR